MSSELTARKHPSQGVGPPRISLCRRPLALAGLVVASLGLVAGVAATFYMLYLLIFLFTTAYLWTRWSGRILLLTRRLDADQAQVGDTIKESFALVNWGHLPLLWAQIDDFSNLPGYNARRVEVGAVGEERTWHTEAVCTRRGLFRLGPARIITGDPFGLFRAQREVAATQQLLVLPALVELPEIELPLGLLQGNARSRLTTPLTTSTVAGIRGYRPGDPGNRIAWRQTARRGELMVKEAEMEPSGSLWLIVDLDAQAQLGEGEQSTLERSIVVGAALARRAIQEGRAVGLVAGRTRLEPQKGGQQLRRLLEVLAVAEPLPGLPLAVVLEQMRAAFGQGCSLVAITPAGNHDWLAQLLRIAGQGVAPVVVLIEGPGPTARQETHLRLASLGFPCYVLSASRQLVFAPAAGRTPVRRYRALGTGGAAWLRREL